jgi:hypothetical protein
MLEIALATTFLSLVILVVALGGRYFEIRRENRERSNPLERES